MKKEDEYLVEEFNSGNIKNITAGWLRELNTKLIKEHCMAPIQTPFGTYWILLISEETKTYIHKNILKIFRNDDMFNEIQGRILYNLKRHKIQNKKPFGNIDFIYLNIAVCVDKG